MDRKTTLILTKALFAIHNFACGKLISKPKSDLHLFINGIKSELRKKFFDTEIGN